MVTVSIAFNIIMAVFGLQGTGYLPMIMMWSLVWGMGGAFVSLLLSRFMAKTMMGVKVIDPQTSDPQLRALVQTVHGLARRAQLPAMPEVGIYASPEVNAFATGPSKSRALVAVSAGLLDRMSADEVEGVLGHEIAHVANGDMVTMTLIQGVVNAFVLFFSRVVAKIVVEQMDSRARGGIYFMLVMIFDILFTLLGSIVVCYFSRSREFRADRGGAQFAGREKMLGALRRLQQNTNMIDVSQKAYATLKISDKPRSVASLFMTHPPLEVRIRTLENASMAI
jgi:heat shock protein HtpX